jgi:surface carbohydrate biosynthesis protein
MALKKPLLLIPVENQVRELDAKLLLSVVAARRGFSSIIGFKKEVESRIASYPRSIYLAKGLFRGNSKFLGLARKLGHENVAWDEEALVHLPAKMYFSRRLSSSAVKQVSDLFAWGENNAELWRQYPELPDGMPIHITGNPRGDLLRPEIRNFYDQDVANIRDQYGDFILINTNFNHVNAFRPDRNLFLSPETPEEEPQFGRAARGMSRKYAEGLRDHKQAVFEDFQKLIPSLEQNFKDYVIVIRPHPTESQEIYRRIADKSQRIRVTNEGNVVPWLMAARALIHNGCTTGVEAFAMRVPAISYRATVNEDYDLGFYRLSNLLSHQCFDFNELQQLLSRILAGDLGALDGNERKELLDHHIAALEGPLACERIIDILENKIGGLAQLPRPPLGDRLAGWFKATKRRVRQRAKSSDISSQNLLKFERHKYPQISLQDLSERIRRFQKLLGSDQRLTVDHSYGKLFRIGP